jgi:hypothetical protein
MATRTPKVTDIVELAGVSRATFLRALRGARSFVSTPLTRTGWSDWRARSRRQCAAWLPAFPSSPPTRPWPTCSSSRRSPPPGRRGSRTSARWIASPGRCGLRSSKRTRARSPRRLLACSPGASLLTSAAGSWPAKPSSCQSCTELCFSWDAVRLRAVAGPNRLGCGRRTLRRFGRLLNRRHGDTVAERNCPFLIGQPPSFAATEREPR